MKYARPGLFEVALMVIFDVLCTYHNKERLVALRLEWHDQDIMLKYIKVMMLAVSFPFCRRSSKEIVDECHGKGDYIRSSSTNPEKNVCVHRPVSTFTPKPI